MQVETPLGPMRVRRANGAEVCIALLNMRRRGLAPLLRKLAKPLNDRHWSAKIATRLTVDDLEKIAEVFDAQLKTAIGTDTEDGQRYKLRHPFTLPDGRRVRHLAIDAEMIATHKEVHQQISRLASFGISVANLKYCAILVEAPDVRIDLSNLDGEDAAAMVGILATDRRFKGVDFP